MENGDRMMAKRLIISGKVQGVWYRVSAKQQADQLGLTGYVRNLPGGAVEAFVQGPEDALIAFESWCRSGPPHAKVLNIESTQQTPDPSLGDFDILR